MIKHSSWIITVFLLLCLFILTIKDVTLEMKIMPKVEQPKVEVSC